MSVISFGNRIHYKGTHETFYGRNEPMQWLMEGGLENDKD